MNYFALAHLLINVVAIPFICVASFKTKLSGRRKILRIVVVVAVALDTLLLALYCIFPDEFSAYLLFGLAWLIAHISNLLT